MEVKRTKHAVYDLKYRLVSVKRRKMKKDIQYFIDGKPASLLEVAENSGHDKVWKSILERNSLQSSQFKQSADRYLKRKLGSNYMNAREVGSFGRIKPRTLNKWRNEGIIRAERLKGIWYYSVESLLACIKSAQIEDITS